MIAFLRDPGWQFIWGLAGLILAVLLYRLQRSRKELSYRIVSNNSLIFAQDTLNGGIQIAFLGKPVTDVRLVILRIQNTGNTPISKSDFEDGVQISFGDTCELLEFEYIGSHPKALSPSAVGTTSGLSIKPLLLNSGDWFDFKFLLSGYQGHLAVNGRIVGVPEITERDLEHRQSVNRIYRRVLIEVVILMVISFVLGGFTNILGIERDSLRSIILIGIVTGMTVIGYFIGTVMEQLDSVTQKDRKR